MASTDPRRARTLRYAAYAASTRSKLGSAGVAGSGALMGGHGVTRRGASLENNGVSVSLLYRGEPQARGAPLARIALPCVGRWRPRSQTTKFFCAVEIFPAGSIACFSRTFRLRTGLEFVWGSGVPSVCGYLLHTKSI